MIRLTPPTYLILFFTSACCIAYGHESSADETEAVAVFGRAFDSPQLPRALRAGRFGIGPGMQLDDRGAAAGRNCNARNLDVD